MLFCQLLLIKLFKCLFMFLNKFHGPHVTYVHVQSLKCTQKQFLRFKIIFKIIVNIADFCSWSLKNKCLKYLTSQIEVRL